MSFVPWCLCGYSLPLLGLNPDPQAATGEALLVVGHAQAGALHGSAHLFHLEETQLVALDQVHGALRRADQVMEIEKRQAPIHHAGGDAGELQIRLIHQLGGDVPGVERSWCRPRLPMISTPPGSRCCAMVWQARATRSSVFR